MDMNPTLSTAAQSGECLTTICRSVPWDVIEMGGFLAAIGGLLLGSILHIFGKKESARDSFVGSLLLIGALLLFDQFWRLGGPSSLPHF